MEITKPDKLEEIEAKKIYKDKLTNYIILVVGFFLLGTAISIVLCLLNMDTMISIIIGIAIFFIAYVIIHLTLFKTLKNSKELIEIAKRNDQIRHEEKIRIKERLYLEKQVEIDKNLSNKEIEDTIKYYDQS